MGKGHFSADVQQKGVEVDGQADTIPMSHHTTKESKSKLGKSTHFSPKLLVISLSVEATMKNARAGVGAAKVSVKPTAASVNVMKVGKRKRGEEEDESGADDVPEDDDEDEGRTAIEQKTKVAKESQPDDTKNKADKGEKNKAKDDAVHLAEDADEQETFPPNKSSKRHRKKVRSRQKNIYKDKRPMEQKPAHLQFGSTDFEGRPITAETRDKLQLPPPKQRRRPMTSQREASLGGKLGIDDLLDDEEEPIAQKKKKMKVKRRPKYKNLAC